MEQETLNNYDTPPAAKPLLYAVADIIGFTYKGGRKVKGEVLAIYHKPKGILLKLHTDYIGKNEEWFKGEEKYFNRSEMKRVNKQ